MTATPPTSAAPVPAPSACPKCGAPVPPGSRFCNACGASMTPAAAPAGAAGAPAVDLRERVDQDRGVLKRLQLLIPGYRGYRQGEDDRAADNLLRLQTADKIRNARTTMENARSSLTNANQFSALTDLAPLLADLQRLEGEIRHAEQGYTGHLPLGPGQPPAARPPLRVRLRIRGRGRPGEPDRFAARHGGHARGRVGGPGRHDERPIPDLAAGAGVEGTLAGGRGDPGLLSRTR